MLAAVELPAADDGANDDEAPRHHVSYDLRGHQLLNAAAVVVLPYY